MPSCHPISCPHALCNQPLGFFRLRVCLRRNILPLRKHSLRSNSEVLGLVAAPRRTSRSSRCRTTAIAFCWVLPGSAFWPLTVPSPISRKSRRWCQQQGGRQIAERGLRPRVTDRRTTVGLSRTPSCLEIDGRTLSLSFFIF